MKNRSRISLMFLIILVSGIISCNNSGDKASKSAIAGPVERVEVSISGMSCTGCEETIQTNVAKLDGVKSVKATFTTGKAYVDYISGLVDTLKIKNAISQSGYVVTGFAQLTLQDSVH